MNRVCLAGLVAAASLLWSAPARKIVIASAALHQFEEGPTLPSGHQFVPGDTVFFGFQVGGYQADEERKIHLEYSVDAFDAKGIPLVAQIKGAIETMLSDEDKNWLPKERQSILLPSFIEPGTYQIVLGVKDVLNGSQARGVYNFTVRGRSIEPSDTLVVRNVRFLRAEDDQAPLNVVAYRQGDAVWARFEITGYKFGANNQMDVAYGLSVLRPTGQVLYAEPNAAREKDQSFYPKRYVPGVLSLKLTPDIATGEYTIVLRVRDNVGNQDFETKCRFRVD
ncbi:MAG: hypothetical protein NTY38_02230 [Acidobacteria bacterium]|nr:hypothetical protein [Acidobacteriota bacterium]